MNGLHLTADLYDCRAPVALMTDSERLGLLCRTAIERVGLTLVGEKWHRFPDHQGSAGGVTGALLLAESHLALHTWPERGGVTLDVYVCNFSQDNSVRARSVLDALTDAFRPSRVQRQELHRGNSEDAPEAASVAQEASAAEAASVAEEASAPAEAGVRMEALNSGSVYGFNFSRRLLSRLTNFQHLELLESPQLGRTLLLDGHFMTSEHDEFFYHEALVHPAALAHPSPRRVLLAGGGDGGAAEELLKHPSVERVTLVDLDPEVVEVARRHLRAIHLGALDDPRVTVHCADAAAFVNETTERFDLVLLDLTDPETPAGPLYTAAFFERLRRVLVPGGAVVLHLGAPFFEPEQVSSLARALQRSYAHVSCYGLHIPLYGAYWAFAVASDTLVPPALPANQVQTRLDKRGIADLEYYNARVHGALFALPTYFQRLVEP